MNIEGNYHSTGLTWDNMGDTLLQTTINLAMDAENDYWFVRALGEKHARIFNQNGEIDD